MKHLRSIIGIILLTGISSCFEEVDFPSEIEDVFELVVTPEMQEFIFNSRDTAYTINEPGMALLLGGQPLALDEIRTRGKSALSFQRKSFSVFLNEPITLTAADGTKIKTLLRFKLISMSMDYTYIENRIAFGILEEQGIMPLFYKYAELKINGQTQGIYLLVEDPEQHYLETGSEYILRRGYYNSIDDSEYAPYAHFFPRESYDNRFREIYSIIAQLQGEELFNALDQRLNLEEYFRKMGIDYLLQNGDYTDEVFLYSLIQQEQIRFSIIPWDYDDLFRDYPHEVGLTWGTGHVFGDRHYNTYQDILDELGDKMIFSIEDDLDYIIAMDPYLYAQYEKTLTTMLGGMHQEDFDQLFQQLKDELSPFYYQEELVSQSRYDARETTFTLWEKNMSEKKAFLKNRLEAMKEQLK